MKTCLTCNELNEDQAKFCKACGMKFIVEMPVTQNDETQITTNYKSKKKIWKRLLIIGIPLVILIVIGSLFIYALVTRPYLSIESYYPMSGGQGSYVVLEVKESFDYEKLTLYYDEDEIQGSIITDNVIGINIPLDAKDGEITIEYKERIDSVPFEVEKERLVELASEAVQPSSDVRTIEFPNDIAITLPENFLETESTIVVSEVENPEVLSGSPFGVGKVYDISIDDMEQLDEYIQIAMAYDPDMIEDGKTIEDYINPLRWDDENDVWVDLYYRIDEEFSTVYFLTDHLSFFTLGLGSVSLVGLSKAALSVGAVAIAAEWLANSTYYTEQGNVRILYSKVGLDSRFTDRKWEKVMSNGSLSSASGYKKNAPYIVQDIGNILETSLETYIDYGLDDPTTTRLFGSLFTRRIKVKIDSYWNVYGAGEFSYTSFWDQINVPTEIIEYLIYDPVLNSPSNYKEAEIFLTQTMAHELFHAIQRPMYGTLLDFRGNSQLWWMEACADYAANDIAWKRSNIILNERIGDKFFDYSIGSVGEKSGSNSPGNSLEYQYLAAIYCRYLVDVEGFDFNEMITYVAKAGLSAEPSKAIYNYAVEEEGYEYHEELLYGGFLLSLIEDETINVVNLNDEAEDSMTEAEVMTIANDTEIVKIKKTESKEGVVYIFKSSMDSGYEQKDMIFVDALVKPSEEVELEAFEGDVYYFFVPNVTESKREVTIGISKEDIETDTTIQLTTHDFSVDENYTANAWVVKVERGQWSMEPSAIEESAYFETYDFTIKGTDISKEIKTVLIEYDFGDKAEVEKKTIEVEVKDGKAEVVISHIFEPLLGENMKEDVTYTVNAVISNGESQMGVVSCPVTLKPISVSILAPRTMIYEMAEGATDANHTFEAMVTPEAEYKFVWNFGDGSTLYEETGRMSTVTHTYNKLGEYSPFVTIYSKEGAELSKDSIHVELVKLDDSELEDDEDNITEDNSEGNTPVEDPFRKYDEGYIDYDYSNMYYIVKIYDVTTESYIEYTAREFEELEFDGTDYIVYYYLKDYGQEGMCLVFDKYGVTVTYSERDACGPSYKTRFSDSEGQNMTSYTKYAYCEPLLGTYITVDKSWYLNGGLQMESYTTFDPVTMFHVIATLYEEDGSISYEGDYYDTKTMAGYSLIVYSCRHD